MDSTIPAFHDNTRQALDDASLQTALGKLSNNFSLKRRQAADRLPEFEALRDAARDIKDHVLDNLDIYLERFEAQVTARGGQVHWCRDAAEARATVLAICRAAGARTAKTP